MIASFYSKIGINCLGACLPCPDCKIVGFYAARHEPNNDIKYRMCKFCGFRQEVEGEPHHCNMFVHEDCPLLKDVPVPACDVVKYDWNAGNSHGHFCGTTMTKTLRPTENDQHPQHALKREMESFLG
jgi:hypothetical protein